MMSVSPAKIVLTEFSGSSVRVEAYADAAALVRNLLNQRPYFDLIYANYEEARKRWSEQERAEELQEERSTAWLNHRKECAKCRDAVMANDEKQTCSRGMVLAIEAGWPWEC